MKHISIISRRAAGFTLVEMAVVLLIVTLLLTGLVPTISSQIEQKHRNETRKQLDEIQQALIGFAMSNGRLPCPAAGNIASGQSGAGQEATTCNASITASGVLPWATLGVSETDAWGRRFTYSVTSSYADPIGVPTYGYDNNTLYGCVSTHMCTPPISPQYASFALCSCGGLNILSAATGGTNVASKVPVAVVSHGTDGLGAWLPQGNQIPPKPSTNPDEAFNSNGLGNFVSHDITPNFDDLVVWISPNILFNRMVAAGKLP